MKKNKPEVKADLGGGGEIVESKSRSKSVGRRSAPRRWFRFLALSPSIAILHGSYAIDDKRFRYKSRGRQAAPCAVVAIVYGRLFEPKSWKSEYIDQILQYGDKLFRTSVTRNQVKDNEYMTTDMVHPELYLGKYKAVVCVEGSGGTGNLFSETSGNPNFAEGLRKFFETNDAGVVTAQGRSVAMWKHSAIGYLLFEPYPCDEIGTYLTNKRVPKTTKFSLSGAESAEPSTSGKACLMRFKEFNDLRDHFLENVDRKFDSKYCIDKITVQKISPVGQGYVDKMKISSSQPDFDPDTLKSVNLVEMDEDKNDCTRALSKGKLGSGVKKKIITEAKIRKEPLLITISNYSIDKVFATDPLVDQDNFDTGYQYTGLHTNLPPTLKTVEGRIAILHGTTHEGSDVYKGKGAQNVANCVMAIAMKKVHPVKTWGRNTLDIILTFGDELYAEVKKEKPSIRNMTSADLDGKRVEIENQGMFIEVDLITVTGTLNSRVPDVLNLKQGLQEFFTINIAGVIEIPEMSIAIWSQDNNYYSFDPRQSDGLGNRIQTEKGGKKGAKDSEGKKIQGKCCVMRFPDTDSLALLFFRNVDLTKRNERFIIRHITMHDDIPGYRPWNDFKPGIIGVSWVMRGRIANDDESLDPASAGQQGLALPVVMLVIARETPPDELLDDHVDQAVREGDNYYSWCMPSPDAGALEEKPFLVSDLKRHFYMRDRKINFELDESIVVGDLSSSKDNWVVPNLENGLARFFEDHDSALVDMKTLKVAVWKAEEEKVSKKNKGDKAEKVTVTFYYYFDGNPRNRFGLSPTAVGFENETSKNVKKNVEDPDDGKACIVRTQYLDKLTKMIYANHLADLEDEDETEEQGSNDYLIHNIRNIAFSEPMTPEEIEADKLIPVRPENHNYSSLGDTGAILAGSYHQADPSIFGRHTIDRQQAGISLAALAMTKIYNPHLWYREVVDDILKLGDKVTFTNIEKLPNPEDTEDEIPRNYLIPNELVDNFSIGTNKIPITVEEDIVTGKTADLENTISKFFDNNNMGILKQEHIMLPIWKENDVYFTLDSRGRDSHGEPKTEKDATATVMWFMDIPSLIKMLEPVLPGENFSIDGANLQNFNESRITDEKESEKTSNEEMWHHFSKLADGVWSIKGKIKMSDERFPEENRNKQTAAIAVIGIVFAKVYVPNYWTASILDEIVVTGDKLHSKCIERLGEDSVSRVNQIMTEFYLSSRRICLTMKDCVESGDLSGKPPKIQSLQQGIDKFFSRYISGVLTGVDNRNIAIWKHEDAYYCLIPNWTDSRTIVSRVFRFVSTELLVEYLRQQLGKEGDYEITEISVVNQTTVPSWRFDPSPAVRPSNLPALNAYRRTQGEARAILRGSYHQGDEVFPEDIRNTQTAANCVVALGMAVIKNPTTWTKRTMDEVMSIAITVHRETKKAKPSKIRLKPWDIIRIFYIGVNILTADIESRTIAGRVAIPPEPDDKKKKNDKEEKKTSKAAREKKEKDSTRHRVSSTSPILLEEGLRKFFETNRAGIVVTDRGMIAIWKDMGVYFMYDPRGHNDQGLPDYYGTSCTMWFACMEPLYDVIFANIDEKEKYGPYMICKVVIKTVMIELLPNPAGYRPYVDYIAPLIPITSTKRTATLDVETVTNYTYVDEELSILRGTLNMHHRAFSVTTRGYQSTAIAAVAIVVSLLHVPSTWTPELIDAILKYGDYLHSDTIRSVRPGPRNLSPSELLTVFIVGDFRACIHIHNHTTAGVLHVLDLAESLTLFFKNNCAGILHTTNVAVAVMQHYGKFYLFDPASKNEEALPSFEGGACVMKCESIMKMAQVFVRNCNLKKPNVYTLNAVNVLSLYFFSDVKGESGSKTQKRNCISTET